MSETRAVRSGQHQDAVICAKIRNDWTDGEGWVPRIHTRNDVVRHYQDFVFAKRQVWVTGQPVDGFVVLDVDESEVTSLYVATPGQGIGKALLDFVKERHRELTLWTFVANTAARRFYRREGFHEVCRTDGDNEEGLPDVFLRWEHP
ncbi:MAG: GNAT family N-acetyltransferase [Boseongicola sp.]